MYPDFVSSAQHVNGSANVGDIIGYGDMANIWEPVEVVALPVPDRWGSGEYTLRKLTTTPFGCAGSTFKSDCRQHGWTFGESYRPEGN